MKTYVITLSQVFPVTHKRAGDPTGFKEKLLKAIQKGFDSDVHPKVHTIRANYELWKKRFDEINAGRACLCVRQWSGKPYQSKQIEIARLTREDGIGIQKLKIYETEPYPFVYTDKSTIPVDRKELAINDGLSLEDWAEWFKGYDLSSSLAVIHFTSFRY